jgi:predicted nucleic acid-binding Zn ribbon protein
MHRTDDRDDDAGDESEYAGFDTSDPDDDVTAPCPYCGTDIFEGGERCPRCGEYLSREDAPAAPQRTWIVVGIVICLVIVAIWIMSGV